MHLARTLQTSQVQCRLAGALSLPETNERRHIQCVQAGGGLFHRDSDARTRHKLHPVFPSRRDIPIATMRLSFCFSRFSNEIRCLTTALAAWAAYLRRAVNKIQ